MTTRRVHRMFRAFSDPIRLRVLSLLREGELGVEDLVSALAVPQPTVSRHLRYLRESGLVRVRRDGRRAFYSLAPASRGFHARLLGCVGCCFDEVPEIRADRRRLGKARSRKECRP